MTSRLLGPASGRAALVIRRLFAELCGNLHRFADEISAALKKRDLEREANPEWYKSNDLTGMMLYIDNFAGDLKGVRRKLPYIEKTGVNMLHLMPFLNYLRCHDDIGWGLDYDWLARNCGADEKAHKRFLSEWFQGHWEGSVSRGELYNDDPASGDARQCGTTASLCGIEKAGFEGTPPPWSGPSAST